MEINIKYDEKLKQQIKKEIEIAYFPFIFLILSLIVFALDFDTINITYFLKIILGSIWFIGAVILYYVLSTYADLNEIKELKKERLK